ncbi:MAG: PQQ-dependent sugar dehydrogenase [Chloroflexota bacterium]|nr:PQQ-dependent sugar dehydrogenase [Chloroflexota bacterium]
MLGWCRRTAGVMLAAFVLTAAAAPAQGTPAPAPFDPAGFAVGLEPVADGFQQPLQVVDANDGSGRLFVVEQTGTIRIVRNGQVEPEPFLDVSDRITAEGTEQGLLGLAFHPNYAENGTFFVGYTADEGEGAGDNTVARFRVSADDPDRADPDSGEVLLAVPDPYGNHNGGQVMFGPDGYLYAGFGDGGSRADPEENAENPSRLLGKILRIDVDDALDGEPYGIPADNPFADGEEGAPEVWAYGLRNPWRFSFDRETGDLWIADVGQNAYEEVNRQPAGSEGGENYGWDLMEGAHCFEAENCEAAVEALGLVLPVAEYGHDLGNSVTGGFVYRGEAIPALRGVYLFADFGTGLLWGLGPDGDGGWARSEPVETGLNVSSFGEDAAGELYATAFDGTLYRLTAGT